MSGSRATPMEPLLSLLQRMDEQAAHYRKVQSENEDKGLNNTADIFRIMANCEEGNADLLRHALSTRSESAAIPEAPRYVGGFCQDRESCLEEAKRLRSLIQGCDCDNYVQCWEPCGRLGHSAKHARVVPEEKP